MHSSVFLPEVCGLLIAVHTGVFVPGKNFHSRKKEMDVGGCGAD